MLSSYSIAAAVIAACIASIISTYVALVTPFGPWMEPVLLFIGVLWLSALGAKTNEHRGFLVSAVVAGGLAGIIATACSFSCPTLFFLEPAIFSKWLTAPFYFILFLALSILVVGSIAFALVSLWEEDLIEKQSLSFPVAQLIHKGMHAIERSATRVFLSSSLGTLLYYGLLSSIGKALLGSWLSAAQLLPMLFSIGAMTTFSFAVPLLVGLVAKSAVVSPIHAYFFSTHATQAFFFSWCAGLIVHSTLISFYHGFLQLINFLREKNHFSSLRHHYASGYTRVIGILLIGSFLSATLLLRFLDFSWFSIPVILVGLTFCSYQLAQIGGKIGLAPLGRFALFLALPGMILFKHSFAQVTLVALFVELCGGMSVDLLFGRKLGTLMSMPREEIVKAQLVGLLIGAVTCSTVLWALCSWGSLGVEPLYAQRAYTRALLLKAPSFDVLGMVLGAIFGVICHSFSINTVMVMTGLLMPAYSVLPLVGGNLVARFITTEHQHAVWAALFAIASLALSLQTLTVK